MNNTALNLEAAMNVKHEICAHKKAAHKPQVFNWHERHDYMNRTALVSILQLDDTQISSKEQLFLLYLASVVDENNVCIRTTRQIMAATSLDKKSILSIRSALIKKKLIQYTDEIGGRFNTTRALKLIKPVLHTDQSQSINFDAIGKVFTLKHFKLTSTEKLVLLRTAIRANKLNNYRAWPGLKQLGKDTGLNKHTIIKTRKSLIDKGLIKYTGQTIGRSKLIPIMYFPFFEQSEAFIWLNFFLKTLLRFDASLWITFIEKLEDDPKVTPSRLEDDPKVTHRITLDLNNIRKEVHTVDNFLGYVQDMTKIEVSCQSASRSTVKKINATETEKKSQLGYRLKSALALESGKDDVVESESVLYVSESLSEGTDTTGGNKPEFIGMLRFGGLGERQQRQYSSATNGQSTKSITSITTTTNSKVEIKVIFAPPCQAHNESVASKPSRYRKYDRLYPPKFMPNTESWNVLNEVCARTYRTETELLEKFKYQHTLGDLKYRRARDWQKIFRDWLAIERPAAIEEDSRTGMIRRRDKKPIYYKSWDRSALNHGIERP